MSSNNFTLAELSILVDVNLRVHTVDVFVGSHGPGVNLNLRCVHFEEHLVQALQLFDALLARLALQSKIVDNFGGARLGQAFVNSERERVNRGWILLSHRFNIHAALL